MNVSAYGIIRLISATLVALTATLCRADGWFDAEALEAMLAKGDAAGLEAAAARPDHDENRMFGWLGKAFESKGSYFLAALYAREMWRIGRERYGENCGLCYGAGVVSLYAYAAIIVDGEKCEDRSIPQTKLARLMGTQAAVFDYLDKKPVASKERAVEGALQYDSRTTSVRSSDDSACRNADSALPEGSDQGIGAGTPRGPGPRPKLLPENVYLPRQRAAREKLPETLRRFLNLRD